MRFPHIPRRWRLRSLMVLVAVSAVGLVAYREYRERGPVYWEIARISFGRASTRSDAALRIGLLGPRASFATWVLDGALDDPDPDVRAEAAYALIRLGSRSPRLVPVLVEQIERTPEPGRIWMQMARNQPLAWLFGTTSWGWPLSTGALRRNDPLQALMLIRPDAAQVVPALRKPLASPANHVRRAALGALFAVASWTTPPSPELAGELLAVVAADRPSTYPYDRRNLEEPFDERKRAVDALARLDRPMQDRAVAMLAADVRELGTPRSYEAVALLTRLDGGTAAAVSALTGHVRDGDDIRRSIALVLLHWIGEPAASAAPTILRVIETQDNDRVVPINSRMSWWVAVSSWITARSMVIGPAVEGRSSVIVLGVKALRGMGKPVERESICELIAVVQDPNRPADQKRGAIVALGDFGPSAGQAVPALVAFVRAVEGAYKAGPGVGNEWKDPGGQAAEAIGRIAEDGNPEVVAILAGLLDSRVGGIAMAAARALCDLGPKATPAILALVKALRSPVPGVRFSASRALGKIGRLDANAVLPALRAAMNDPDRYVRDEAAETLQKIEIARERASSSRPNAGAGDKPPSRR